MSNPNPNAQEIEVEDVLDDEGATLIEAINVGTVRKFVEALTPIVDEVSLTGSEKAKEVLSELIKETIELSNRTAVEMVLEVIRAELE